MDSVARVRIFAAGEFAVPAGWPDDVGVAAILADGIEVFPAHARESGADVLRRITALTERDLRGAPVHPAVAGHPACDLSFSAVAELRSAVEDFLSRFPEAVEEADDFAVNFGYAADEGIALPALLGPSLPAVPAGSPPTHQSGMNPLSGYVPLSDMPALPSPFPGAVLRVNADGGLMILLDPDLPVLSAVAPSVLLREDGMGLAVPTDALSSGAVALRLPAGCLPWIPQGVEGEIPLLAVERSGYLLLSFLPEWAWITPQDANAATAQAEADQGGKWGADGPALRRWVARCRDAVRDRWRKPLAGLALLVATVIAVGAGLGVAGRGDAQSGAAIPAAAVDALRAGLFG